MLSYDFSSFYHKPIGQNVQNILRHYILTYWPDYTGLSCAGIGYIQPYLDLFVRDCDVLYDVSLHECMQGEAISHKKIIPILCDEQAFGLVPNSVDFIFLIHSLEHSQYPHWLIGECAQALAPGGRLVIVTPNILGLWSYKKTIPYGVGRAFYASDLVSYTQKYELVVVRDYGALYVPPVDFALSERVLRYGEKLPILPRGVHILEVKKELYKPIPLRPRRKLQSRFKSALASS